MASDRMSIPGVLARDGRVAAPKHTTGAAPQHCNCFSVRLESHLAVHKSLKISEVELDGTYNHHLNCWTDQSEV